MVSPSDGERILTQDIRRTYIQAEKDIISKVANFVKKGKDVPGWHKRKLAQLDQFTGEVQQEILEEQLGTVRDKKIREGVKKAYQKGQRSAVNALKEGGQDVAIAGRFGETDRRTVEALSRSLTQSLNNTHFRITREAEDVYRRVVGEGIRGHVAGGQSRIEASQRILNDFADQGIVGFTDRTGRNWSLSAYTEMATRTTAGQAALEGQVNRMKDNDHDLAIVGTSYEPCPICMPWEEVVLSISGENEDYPSLADAEGAGLFHPNCTHSLTPYIEGVTEKETEGKEEKADKAERYQEREQQRHNERQIRKWKKRKVGCMTEDECLKASQKIKEWQEKQRNFIDETGRYRKYNREQITGLE